MHTDHSCRDACNLEDPSGSHSREESLPPRHLLGICPEGIARERVVHVDHREAQLLVLVIGLDQGLAQHLVRVRVRVRIRDLRVRVRARVRVCGVHWVLRGLKATV